MKIKKAISSAVTGGDNYHEIMRPIAVYSLQKQAAYNPPQGDLSEFEALPYFNVARAWRDFGKRRYGLKMKRRYGMKMAVSIITELRCSEPICEDCAWLLENMINSNKFEKTIRIEANRGSETCYFCEGVCDDIPF